MCFTGDTLVAVADGRNAVRIDELAKESSGDIAFPVYSARERINKSGMKTEIKNAVAIKTGTQPVIKLTLSDGSSFKCTPDHELFLASGGSIKAKDSLNLNLEKFFTTKGQSRKYRHINSVSNGHAKQHKMLWEFYNGKVPSGYTIDHIENVANDSLDNLQILSRDEHLVKTIGEVSGENNAIHKVKNPDAYKQNSSLAVSLENNPNHSGLTDEYIIELAKILVKNGKCVTFKNLRDIDERCPSSFSKNRFGGKISNLKNIASGSMVYEKPQLGKKVVATQESYQGPEFLTVVEIEDLGIEDVYDLSVDTNHNFYIITSKEDDNYLECSGVLVHNCNEIHLVTDEDRTAVCCLSSINLHKYEQWKNTTIVQDLIRFLDNTLEYFIQHAPETISKAIVSAKRERSLGLGAFGFHALLQSKNIAFESEDAVKWNKRIFMEIKNSAVKESFKMGKELGVFPDLNEAIFDGFQCPTTQMLRNAHLLAIAPNANSAVIAGTSPSIELWKSNAFVHETRAGVHKSQNTELKKVLQSYDKDTDDVWQSIVNNNGSVSHLEFLSDHERNVFKTAIEVNQMWVVRHCADRQPFICQGQSVNIFFPPNCDRGYMNQVHYEAWKQGLKGLYYLRTEKSTKVENIDFRVQRTAIGDGEKQDDECLACQG